MPLIICMGAATLVSVTAVPRLTMSNNLFFSETGDSCQAYHTYEYQTPLQRVRSPSARCMQHNALGVQEVSRQTGSNRDDSCCPLKQSAF